MTAPDREEEAKIPKPGYVCRKCGQGGHFIRDCPEFAKQQEHLRSKDCWFCLGTPTVESHLIISIADHMYMALAKGPLTRSHVLLMPIQHRYSSLELGAAELEELEQYKDAIRKWFASQRCRALFYERFLPTKSAQHMHIQCIPIPDTAESHGEESQTQEKDTADPKQRDSEEGEGDTVSSSIAETIQRLGSEAIPESIDFQSFPDLPSLREYLRESSAAGAASEGGAGEAAAEEEEEGGKGFRKPFIAFELPGGDGGGVLAHFPKTRRGDLFVFARRVSAELLGTPEKVDWKRCQMTKEEETEATDALKNSFGAFDFVEEEEDDDDSEDDDSDAEE